MKNPKTDNSETIKRLSRFVRIGKLTMKRNQLRLQASALSEEIRKLSNTGCFASSSEFNGTLTIEVSLADYLAVFPEIAPEAQTYDATDGQAGYSRLHYPPVLAGEFDGRKLLIEAFSERFSLSQPVTAESAVAA